MLNFPPDHPQQDSDQGDDQQRVYDPARAVRKIADGPTNDQDDGDEIE